MASEAGSQEVSQYSAESRRRSEGLTGALGPDQHWQNSTACVDGHRAAVQESYPNNDHTGGVEGLGGPRRGQSPTDEKTKKGEQDGCSRG